MRKLFFYLSVLGITILTSCEKDKTESSKSISSPDPEGTITLDITNSRIENHIYISNGNLQGALFTQIGQVNGLGDITFIPRTGWTTHIAAIEQYGYIAWINGIYYRLYLSTLNSEKVLVKYQKPFLGSEKYIIPTEKSVSFQKTKSDQTIIFSNKNLFPYTVKSSEDWCRTYPMSLTENTPYEALQIEATANDKLEPRKGIITISSNIGEDAIINVIQEAAEGWLSIEKSELNFEGNASSIQTRIISNTEWSAHSNSPWCRIEQSTNTLTVIVDENNLGKSRKAIITITTKDSKDEKQIVVNQNIPILNISKNILKFDGVASSDDVIVSSNISSWIIESNQTWCTFQKKDNIVTIYAGENTSGKQRTAIVSIIMHGLSKEIIVNQDIPTFSISQESFSFDGCSSKDNFTVMSNSTSWEVLSNQSWCIVRKSNEIVEITVLENSFGTNREAIIAVKMLDGRSRNISVIQSKPILSISSDIINVSRAASDTHITNISNVLSWHVHSDASWCSVFNVNGVLQISASENVTMLRRETNIRIELYSDVITIPIIQNARDLGDYYEGEDGDGIIFEISEYGEHGKIVSLDESSYVPWHKKVNNINLNTIFSSDDGLINLAIAINASENGGHQFSNIFVPMAWCQNKGKNWYLPAINELKVLLQNTDMINMTISQIPLPNNALYLRESYWTSTLENATSTIYYIRLNSKPTILTSQYYASNAKARAICKF